MSLFKGYLKFGSYTLIIVLISSILVLPLLSLVWAWQGLEADIWQHLRDYVLFDMVLQTLALMVLVALLSLLLALPLAWCSVYTDFWGRRALPWLLMLPMAIPAYVLATVWLGWFAFDSNINQWLWQTLSQRLSLSPLIGASVVLSLSLYPYIFFTARNAFLQQGQRYSEAAASLGLSPRQRIFKINLNLALPSILAGLSLVMMETVADFGVVALFNLNTFSHVIYKVWFGLYSVHTALQLASLLLLLVFVLMLLKQRWQSSNKRMGLKQQHQPIQALPLRGIWRVLVPCWAYGVLLLAFVLPVASLSINAAQVWAQDADNRLWQFAYHSLLLSSSGALLIVFFALLMLFYQRFYLAKRAANLTLLLNLGYAIPGAVLAVAWFAPAVAIENGLYEQGFTVPLTGGLMLVLMAYASRFMAVGYEPLHVALARLPQNLDAASASLKVMGWARIRRIYLPLLRTPILTALLLVFVELIKELPMTLMTRPFGYDTLAIRVFEMANEGEWQRAALPSLLLVLVGLVPIYLMIRGMHNAQRH